MEELAAASATVTVNGSSGLEEGLQVAAQLQTLSVAGGEAEAALPSEPCPVGAPEASPGLPVVPEAAPDGSNEEEPLGPPQGPSVALLDEGPSLLGNGGEGGEMCPEPAEEPSRHSPLQEGLSPAAEEAEVAAAPAPSPLDVDGPSERSPAALGKVEEKKEEEAPVRECSSSSSTSSASSSESESQVPEAAPDGSNEEEPLGPPQGPSVALLDEGPSLLGNGGEGGEMCPEPAEEPSRHSPLQEGLSPAAEEAEVAAAPAPSPLDVDGPSERSPAALGKVEEKKEEEAPVRESSSSTSSASSSESESQVPEAAPDGSNEEQPLGPPQGPSVALLDEGPSLLGNGGEGGEMCPEPAEEPSRHSPLQEGLSPAAEVAAAPAPSPLDVDGPSERSPAALGKVEEKKEEEAPVRESSSSSSTSSASSSESESESESDTDTDSSSSDSSSSSCLPMLSEDDDDQQNNNEDNSSSTTKNGEMSKQEPLCVEDVTIILPESVELMPFGKVSSIIGHLVIVESQKGLPPVNEDTVLFKDDRRSVGKVFEVFGPVSHPFYVLQFNSPEHIESKDIKIHDAIYFAPSVESFTQYIFPEKIKQEKGSDASWMNDLEPPPEALDFSDDEKERAAKQQKKSQKLRRKKLRSLQDYDKYDDNGINYHPRQQQHSSDYSEGYYRGEPHPTFSNRRFPHPPPPPHFFRPQASTPQHYSSYHADPWKPSEFCQQQRPEDLIRHQHSFPPPPFETVNNQANFPPPQPSVTWGWSPWYTHNMCDPLLSLLSLPPPPPPPLPPP